MSEKIKPAEKRRINSNISHFVGDYVHKLKSTLHLKNHTRVIDYGSDPECLDLRENAIADYLFSYRRDVENKSESYYLGRTILAEVVTATNIAAAYGGIFEREGLDMVLAPTQLDESNFEFNSEYRKGADCCVVSGDCGLLGIDVTITDQQGIENKISNPGVQLPTDMPVLVTPMRDLHYRKPKRNKYEAFDFADYLDSNARKAISRYGFYPEFAGLTDGDRALWRNSLLVRMLNGIVNCRTVLDYCPHPAIGAAPNIGIIKDRLQYASELTLEALRIH